MFILSVWVFAVVQVIQGQTITPVYVQINVPVTLTCPADDQVTNLTWTGPGGHLLVTGTTVEDGVDGGSIPRISADHFRGSYTLTFTQVLGRDTGIYTCTMNGRIGLQMVIVQGVTSASSVYTRQGGTVTLQCTDTGGRNPQWQVTSPSIFIYTIGTQFNPSLPESTRTRLSVTRQDGNYNLQISDVQLSDVREYGCSMGTTSAFFHLLLYILPTFPGIENTVTVDGQNRTTGTEGGSLTLTCNARGGFPSANVTWIKDGVSLVTSENKVQYTNVFTRADDRTQFTCQSSSPALTSPQTTSVLVYLDLKPQQPTISAPSSQTVNTDLQVVCMSTGSRPAADIEWNVGGTWLSSNPEESKVLDTSTDTYTVTSSLSRRVTRQDNGKFVYCRVSNRALSGGIESVRQTITVLYGPDTVGITGNRVVVADGTNTLTLTCTTQEYNRHVHITWYNGTTRIPNTAAVTNTSGSYGGFISTQVLQLVPDRYQDGNVVRCVVQNEDVTVGERTASVTLDIMYSPFLMLTARPGERVIEGSELEIRCDVDSNPALSSITWSRVGGQLPSHADVTSGVLRIPFTQRTDKGTYRCVAVNSIGSDEDTIVIDIYYPPDVIVRYTNTTFISQTRVLTCDPEGNPDKYQFGSWRHTSESGTEIRQLNGSSTPLQAVLTLYDPGMTRRYEDTGYYACTASNNIPDSSFYSSGSVLFVVEAPPVIISNAITTKGKTGENIKIEVEFYSRPAVSLSDITWTRGTNRVPPSGKFVISLEMRSINTSFYGVDVQAEGYATVLKINEIAEGDFDIYTVSIENGLGTVNMSIQLINTDPPSPPLYLLQKDVTSSSITVQWISDPGRDQGETYIIEYRPADSDVTSYSNAIPDDMEPVMAYTIDELSGNTLYYITVQSQNSDGSSQPLMISVSTTAFTDNDCSKSELYTAGVALISVSSAFLLVVVVVAVVMAIKIRKINHRNKPDNQEIELSKKVLSDTGYSAERHASSKYVNTDTTTANPESVSVYEDIPEQPHRMSITEERSNTYESLGRRSAPNVYEGLSTRKSELDTAYEDTIIKTEVQSTYQNQ